MVDEDHRTLKAAFCGEPFEHRGRWLVLRSSTGWYVPKAWTSARLCRPHTRQQRGLEISTFSGTLARPELRFGTITMLKRSPGAVSADDWVDASHHARRFVEDVAIRQTADGFVWQVVLSGSAPSGSVVAELCMVVGVSDEGLISRIEEYMDPASFGPLTG